MSLTERVKSKTYPMERVEFLCDKSLFKGKVYRPADLDNCKGIVIFTHGLGYCDRQYDVDGQYFADNNYLMLTYNLRGHAGTPGKWTLQNSVDDLIEGINFLTRRYDFPNKERICVIGHSTGALITLLASLKDPRIKFGSVVTTVTCLRDSYLHWFKSGFNQEVKELFKSKGALSPVIERFLKDEEAYHLLREGKIAQSELNVPHRYGLLRSEHWGDFLHEIIDSVDIIQLASKIKIPLLLFRGEYDEVMDVKKTNELYECLSKKIPSKLYVTDSKNHFHNDKWGIIQSKTLNFFDAFCQFKKKIDVSGKEILIIDDEPMVTKTLGRVLRKHGFEKVSTANSGEAALRKIASLQNEHGKCFDMIITDIRMPGLDGIETIRKVKEIMGGSSQPGSSVIFMTGYDGDRAREDAKALGYVDYLYKPFDLEAFVTSVKKHLEP